MPKAFDAGLCRYLVTIEELTGAQDSTGQELPNWQTFATAWASIEGLSGNERQVVNQIFATASTRIRMRFVDGITPKMRITYSGRHFDILDSSDPDGRRRYLELICTERVEAGA